MDKLLVFVIIINKFKFYNKFLGPLITDLDIKLLVKT